MSDGCSTQTVSGSSKEKAKLGVIADTCNQVGIQEAVSVKTV